MAGSNEFNHNPVYTKTGFSYTTFNMALKLKDEDKKKRALNAVIQKNCPDIIFLQELKESDKEICSDCDEYCFKVNDKDKLDCYTGLMVNKSVFEISGGENTDRFIEELASKILKQTCNRQCTLVLKHVEKHTCIVAVSWHGRHKIKKNIKKEDFTSLKTFSNEIRVKYSANDVIIGGDFNIGAHRVKDEVGKGFFKINAPKSLQGSRIRGKNIDYFVSSLNLNVADVDSIDINNDDDDDDGDGDDDSDDDSDDDDDEQSLSYWGKTLSDNINEIMGRMKLKDEVYERSNELFEQKLQLLLDRTDPNNEESSGSIDKHQVYAQPDTK